MTHRNLMSRSDRFNAKIQRGPECWLWTAYRNACGYGVFSDHGGKLILAHRFAWQEANGPIPEGRQVLHSCDNPPCVSPEHLFLGTEADNSRDMMRKGRGRKATGEAHGSRTAPTSKARGEDHGRAKLSRDTVLAIVAVRREGKTHREIAEALGVTHVCVGSVLRGETWSHIAGVQRHEPRPVGNRPKGERHGSSKLTADTVRAIRAAYAPGEVSFAELGARFGVSGAMAQRIVRRLNWKHIE